MVICVFLFSLHSQTNQSFEAQEVSSPTQTQVQPQWRQKVVEEIIIIIIINFYFYSFMIESRIETVSVAVQVKRVEDELLTDEVEGPQLQQKKTEDEAGGMEKTSTFSYKPHPLQFHTCACASDSPPPCNLTCQASDLHDQTVMTPLLTRGPSRKLQPVTVSAASEPHGTTYILSSLVALSAEKKTFTALIKMEVEFSFSVPSSPSPAELPASSSSA